MSKADELFKQAYNLHVVEHEHRKAMDLCRQILQSSPDHHMTRMLLGCILGDHGITEDEIIESKGHFIEALRMAENIQVLLRNAWAEEDPVYQLGLWEWNRGNICNAVIFFIIEMLVSPCKYSQKHLSRLLVELDPDNASFIEYLLSRIMAEHGQVPPMG